MKHLVHTLLFSILLGLTVSSCNHNKNRPQIQEESQVEENGKTIIIQPFAGFSPSLIDSVAQQLRKINPNIKINQPIELPLTAYNSHKTRFRADSLIRFLYTKVEPNSTVIGLTDKDISMTKGDIQDWGIMGLAYCPGKSCIISTYRLSKKNLYNQLYKLAIHELGHTQGLGHCEKDSSCFMRDANGYNHLDELHDFCWWCKPYLRGKGWTFD